MPPSPVPCGEPPSGASRFAGGTLLPLVPGFERPPARRRPLPDAAAVRLLPVPDTAPPYDDDLPAPGCATPGSRRLRLVPPPPETSARADHREAPAGAPAHNRLVSAQARGERTHTEPGQPTAEQDPPGQSQQPPGHSEDPSRRRQAAAAEWPSQFARVLAETLAGSRPQGQIVPWTTDQARKRIRQLGPMLAAGTAPRVHRIVTSLPAENVVEMTVVVGFGPRVRALAVRLERDGPHRPAPGRDARAARWVCTVIEAA
jgi:Family of unknown function (DUF6459)